MKHISTLSRNFPSRASSLLSKQYQLQNAAAAVSVAQDVFALLSLPKSGENENNQ